MAEASPSPARSRTRKKAEPAAQLAGPADIHDPVLRGEFKRAAVWIGLAAALALVAYLARPLLIIFGGMVFAALIDGGTRLLGRVLNIDRVWRAAIVLAFTVAFLLWTAMFAGSQIAAQAALLPEVIQAQSF
jgi:predicted PurR-regulated permease PerM